MKMQLVRACLAVSVIIIGAALASLEPRASAQDGTPLLSPVPSSSKVKKTAKTFTVDIAGENLSDVGAFQVVLTFDSAVIKATSIVKTDFLGSSGREVACPDPTITTQSVSLLCVTPGGTAEGVSGNGVLAIVTFEPVAEGTSSLTLTAANLSNPQGGEITLSTADGQVKITGEDSPLFWIVVGIAAGVAALVVVAAVALRWRRRPISGTMLDA